MSLDYATAPYGRQADTDSLFGRFRAGKNLLMPGPRRLGKTFVLERLEERAAGAGFLAARIDVSHCRDEAAFFAKLCDGIEAKRGRRPWEHLGQRLRQLVGGGGSGGAWYAEALRTDWSAFADRLAAEVAADGTPWLLLVDELPIFLLHLQGESDGRARTRSFAYRLRELRGRHPTLRWLFTGSIGIEPLARQGEYIGALNDLEPYDLQPLTASAATALVVDWARYGLLEHRRHVTPAEAEAVAAAVGWCSAYYLEALARQLRGEPAEGPAAAAVVVSAARDRLLEPAQRNHFESWPEHLRKNFDASARSRLFALLAYLSDYDDGASSDLLLASLGDTSLGPTDLRRLLNTLEEDGFLLCDHDAGGGAGRYRFRMELLRLWWRRYLPE